MKKLSQRGAINVISISFFAVCVALVVSIVLAASFFSGENKYKNNTNQLIAAAVANAQTKLTAQLNAQFQATNNATVTSFSGPSQYGSVVLDYPKSWSGYVDTAGSNPLDGYFNPGVVPSLENQSNVYALRLQVVADSYSNQLAQYTAQQQNGTVSISPYALKLVPQVVGVLITGQVQPSKQGVMVMLPLRTDTLLIWTESTQYSSLFTNQILQSVTFQP